MGFEECFDAVRHTATRRSLLPPCFAAITVTAVGFTVAPKVVITLA